MSDEKACFWCGARGGFAHSTWCQHYRRPPMPALPAVLCASYPAPDDDGFKMVAGEGTKLKRQQLEREICTVSDPTLRSNLLHTFSKLFMFLEEDIRMALKEAARNPYPVRSR